jgi:hypothetical protein
MLQAGDSGRKLLALDFNGATGEERQINSNTAKLLTVLEGTLSRNTAAKYCNLSRH